METLKELHSKLSRVQMKWDNNDFESAKEIIELAAKRKELTKMIQNLERKL